MYKNESGREVRLRYRTPVTVSVDDYRCKGSTSMALAREPCSKMSPSRLVIDQTLKEVEGDMNNRILTLHEVTKRVPYSEKHIRRLAKAGSFPPLLRVGPRRVGILESELDEWIANRMPLASIASRQANGK